MVYGLDALFLIMHGKNNDIVIKQKNKAPLKRGAYFLFYNKGL